MTPHPNYLTSWLAQLGEPKMWADFGLAGLVIFALFMAGFGFFAWVFKHLSTVTQMHHSERLEWRETSAMERNEWRAEHALERKESADLRREERIELLAQLHKDREESSAANGKMSAAIDGLKDVLTEMKTEISKR